MVQGKGDQHGDSLSGSGGFLAEGISHVKKCFFLGRFLVCMSFPWFSWLYQCTSVHVLGHVQNRQIV